MSWPSMFEGALWRVVARHEAIEETTAAIGALLAESTPFRTLSVQRWDPARSQLEAVAQVGARAEGERQRVLSPAQQEALVAWAATRDVHVWPTRAVTAAARVIVPDALEGRVVSGPCFEGDKLLGVVILGTDAADARAAVRATLEPFAAALQGDARLHELGRLREAAELDRSALLARLARADVSDAIVGAEHGLRDVMGRVAQVAPTDAPVLILGETGAGKEVVARAIHTRSQRHAAPFLRVNCGAIPTELVDSELFGHERGSFTGAVNLRKGWFERADGGTLFLDEIAELPPAAQVRLLRVLQDGSFQRVGGQEPRNVDVRIVAATHRDMPQMVRDGRFRQDLWYRISVFPVQLPALRERRGDIPALARHFAERAGQRLFGRPLPLEPEDLTRLTAYDWPGNVRELAAVIERAAILGNGQGLHVGPALGLGASVHPTAPVAPVDDDPEAITAALRTARGRIEGPFGAAAALGVNPHTLRSRMRRLGIDWARYRGG